MLDVKQSDYKWKSQYEPPLVGTVYGELTVIEDITKTIKTVKNQILAQCSCGEVRNVYIMNLLNGRSTSCGHVTAREIAKRRNTMRNTPSACAKLLNVHGGLPNGHTMIQFEDNVEGFEDDLHRVKSYTILQSCGHMHYEHETTRQPTEVANSLNCWCTDQNPLSRERRRNDLTLKEVGRQLGVTKQAISLWEKPDNNIKQENLTRLFEIYNSSKEAEQDIIRFKLQNKGKIT